MEIRKPMLSVGEVFAFLLSLATVSRIGMCAALGYADLHNFSFGKSDGSSPTGGVAIYGSKIYGTTSLWGSGEEGVLYSVNLDGNGLPGTP